MEDLGVCPGLRDAATGDDSDVVAVSSFADSEFSKYSERSNLDERIKNGSKLIKTASSNLNLRNPRLRQTQTLSGVDAVSPQGRWCSHTSRRTQVAANPSALLAHLLRRVREQIRERAVALIRLQKFVTIVTDPWTNVNHSTIINFMVVSPGMPSVFWSSLATGTDSESAEYLARHLGRVIDEVERETGSVVAGVLSDNASNMSAAWELFGENSPDLRRRLCSAHAEFIYSGCVSNGLLQGRSSQSARHHVIRPRSPRCAQPVCYYVARDIQQSSPRISCAC
ncbi:unnamed protein product [Phytophthora fragariaefolia]|uniref:Unnamed protein product n=1 Tax=Phytophthora fragariaefolia TaxID=1490495 RepID=A0A9W6Y2H3_9STRA|nr:unnamed protein product [Phytophthora fragariaefolia]